MNRPNRVLIVDDDENIRLNFSRILTEFGYSCESAIDGEQGLEELGRGEYAVALIDLMMPRMDGFELLSALSKTTIDTIPVILTGEADIPKAVEAMKLGAFDFIEKPCSPETLRTVIHRASEHYAINLLARAMSTLVERWETTFDAWPDVILVLDSDRHIIQCNRAAADKAELDKSEIIGRPCHETICFGSHPLEECPFQKTCSNPQDGSREFYHAHWGIHYELVSVILNDHSGRTWGTLHIARDISQRKRAEEKLANNNEQLRALTSELALTEEKARRHIAGELHDGIGQSLAMAKVRLDILRGASTSTDVANDLMEIRELIDQTIHATRSLTFDLSPPVLYEVGLQAAVTSLLEKIQREDGVATTLEDDDQPLLLDRDIKVLLFQAVRELLVNAVKHAKAGCIKVAMHQEADRIHVTVEDDGIGFDPRLSSSAGGSSGGFGLFNIRQRFTYLDGDFQVDSKPGMGTKITLVAQARSLA